MKKIDDNTLMQAMYNANIAAENEFKKGKFKSIKLKNGLFDMNKLAQIYNHFYEFINMMTIDLENIEEETDTVFIDIAFRTFVCKNYNVENDVIFKINDDIKKLAIKK